MIKFVFIILLSAYLTACGGGNSSSSNDSHTIVGPHNPNDSTDKSRFIELVHNKTYSLPHWHRSENILFDQNRVILAGGAIGQEKGASRGGHIAFSKSIYVINLDTGDKSEYSIEQFASENNSAISGIGSQSIIRKLGDNRYLIYGGYQYATRTFILDLNSNTIESYLTNLKITDTEQGGLNTTPFYANAQASAVFDNGDHAFFGFNNGLYGMDAIIRFNNTLKTYNVMNAKLTMSRSHIDAYKLPDGQILLVGGWNGSASVKPDSATRRAELYDPVKDTIQRVADYPEPKHGGQSRNIKTPTSDSSICVGKHTFIYADKSWETGCNISSSASLSPLDKVYDPSRYGIYLGEARNGDLVFLKDNYNVKAYSDDCQCEPYVDATTVISVFSIKQ